MPAGIEPIVLPAEQGAALAIVHEDGTSDVYSIPHGAIVTIQPAVGLGPFSREATSADKESTEVFIGGIISIFGAV